MYISHFVMRRNENKRRCDVPLSTHCLLPACKGTDLEQYHNALLCIASHIDNIIISMVMSWWISQCYSILTIHHRFKYWCCINDRLYSINETHFQNHVLHSSRACTRTLINIHKKMFVSGRKHHICVRTQLWIRTVYWVMCSYSYIPFKCWKLGIYELTTRNNCKSYEIYVNGMRYTHTHLQAEVVLFMFMRWLLKRIAL